MSSEVVQPLVSIVVPSFNHAPYLQLCIESILAQDYANIELIIIDDGSTDCSAQIIEALVPRCTERFVRFESYSRPNKGLSATVDEGLRWARGEYFAAIASDDVMFPGKTSTLVKQLLGEPGVAGVFSGCTLIDATGAPIQSLRPKLMYYDFSDLLLNRKVYIFAVTQLLHRGKLIEVGGYPSNLYIEDWYMWLKLTEHGYLLQVIPDVLAGSRQHGSNVSKNAIKMYEGRKAVLGHFCAYPGIDIVFAKVSLMAAIDFSSTAKSSAFGYIVEAVRMTPRVIFTALFFSALGRSLTPSSIIYLMRSAKARLQHGAIR